MLDKSEYSLLKFQSLVPFSVTSLTFVTLTWWLSKSAQTKERSSLSKKFQESMWGSSVDSLSFFLQF